jgi:hypothetical protein
LVDERLQLLAHLEKGQSLGGHGDLVARTWIAAVIRLVTAHGKRTVAPDLDAFAALERCSHGIEDTVHNQFGTTLGYLRAFRDSLDELRFRHQHPLAKRDPVVVSKTKRVNSDYAYLHS